MSWFEYLIAWLGGPLLVFVAWLLVKSVRLRDQEVKEIPRKPEDETEYWRERAKVHRVNEKQLDYLLTGRTR